MTETDICNLALGKIGGASDILSGNAFITDIDGTDKVSSWCKTAFPRVRRRVIIDLAIRECPFRETIRFVDLGSEIASGETPEIGDWEYAFNLPGDCLAVVRQFEETSIASRTTPVAYQTRSAVNYQWEEIANKDGNGKILLTDTLSNADEDSAFIEYVTDITAVGAFSEQMVDAIATLLASELCPVVGRDIETRRNMMIEYYEVALPNAQRANQRGFDNTARSVPDLSGGRAKVLRSTGNESTNYGYTAI